MSKAPRTPRSKKSLKRKPPKLSGDLILIVCEGEKTEPGYFMALRKRWKIPRAQIDVCGQECGSDPGSVVTYARDKSKQPRDDGLRYDQAWCVMDADDHANLSAALNTAKANNLNVCMSVPCFEFWFLLHFEYTTRSFENSAALIGCLRKHLPNRMYNKSSPPIRRLMPLIETALNNARRVREDNERAARDNPQTDVDKLVLNLLNIKDTYAHQGAD